MGFTQAELQHTARTPMSFLITVMSVVDSALLPQQVTQRATAHALRYCGTACVLWLVLLPYRSRQLRKQQRPARRRVHGAVCQEPGGDGLLVSLLGFFGVTLREAQASSVAQRSDQRAHPHACWILDVATRSAPPQPCARRGAFIHLKLPTTPFYIIVCPRIHV